MLQLCFTQSHYSLFSFTTLCVVKNRQGPTQLHYIMCLTLLGGRLGSLLCPYLGFKF